MLKALALHLTAQKEKFYTISYQTGATRADSWIDIEGGIGNLFANASLRRKLPDEIFCRSVMGSPLVDDDEFLEAMRQRFAAVRAGDDHIFNTG